MLLQEERLLKFPRRFGKSSSYNLFKYSLLLSLLFPFCLETFGNFKITSDT